MNKRQRQPLSLKERRKRIARNQRRSRTPAFIAGKNWAKDQARKRRRRERSER